MRADLPADAAFDPAPIGELLARLRERFGSAAIPIVERWDRDVCAVGCRLGDGSERLVFVSISQQADGRYAAALEPGSAHSPRLGLDELVALVAEHLCIVPLAPGDVRPPDRESAPRL